ncbi:MAG: DUF998 domain-containing protein [Candidatus Aenigmarchaeota archaeon]|nr:DUF998 domain-containing protein [Candidatus Aenigmarchaeota archaeon]
MKKSREKTDRFIILSGFIGALTFLLAIAVSGALYPGYNHVSMVISELGASDSPVHLIMNIFGFGLLGVLTALFALGVYRSPELHIAGKFSSIFFFITGILMILVAISPTYTDIGIYAPDDLHQLAVIWQFPVLTIALLLFAFDAWQNKKLRILAPVILAVGAITLILGYNYLAVWPPPIPVGIIQRLTIGLAYALVAAISIMLYKVQFNTPLKKILLGAAVIVIISLAVALPQQLEINDSHANQPTLRGLCYGLEECNQYCQNRYGTCSQICQQEPENQLCGRIAVLRTGG